MFGNLYPWVALFENCLWEFLCVPLFLATGIFLSVKGRFVQVRAFPTALATFRAMLKRDRASPANTEEGIHPLKAFFACVGGCLGIGNIVGVCTAIQIGGPGALFWLWVTALLGTILKYSEVYLGMRFRVSTPSGALVGGPMFFLRRAFRSPFFANAVALLLCLYGVEIYQFNVVTTSFTENFALPPTLVVAAMLGLVLFAGCGGVQRVGAISSTIVPLFAIVYISMGAWVLGANITKLPAIALQVLQAAFSPHAAVGGFIGATLMTTISQGVRRGCYTGDFGIGYASVIHSASREKSAEKQAALVFIDTFLDTFVICSTTIMLILTSGVWQEDWPSSMLVQQALATHFPYMEYFIPIFLFLLGYSTINAYFCVGLQCAQLLAPNWGRRLFLLYGSLAFILFSFVDSTFAQSVMQIVGGLLLLINCIGILKLLPKLSFAVPSVRQQATSNTPATAPALDNA